ncbi:hypothetical protein FRB99_000553 [Tulasnella sp. 403]|nr:hypothetical protein FRB99_000553 [Tulasnella sp. 403]
MAEFVNGTGTENGILDPNGFVHTDVRSTWVFADGDPAFVTFQGLGALATNGWFKFAVETGSTTFGYLNNLFIVGNDTIKDGTISWDLWSSSDPDAPAGNSTKAARA